MVGINNATAITTSKKNKEAVVNKASGGGGDLTKVEVPGKGNRGSVKLSKLINLGEFKDLFSSMVDWAVLMMASAVVILYFGKPDVIPPLQGIFLLAPLLIVFISSLLGFFVVTCSCSRNYLAALLSLGLVLGTHIFSTLVGLALLSMRIALSVMEKGGWKTDKIVFPATCVFAFVFVCEIILVTVSICDLHHRLASLTDCSQRKPQTKPSDTNV